jgi:HD-GYP domain-containing protein (c-di-GMP phosphodiesterase class II)
MTRRCSPISSERSRVSRSDAAAVAEIKRASGTQFDAKVVDAFLACGQGRR